MRVKDQPGDLVSLAHPRPTFIKKILHLLQCIAIFDKAEKCYEESHKDIFIPP